MTQRFKKWGLKRFRAMWRNKYTRKIITLGMIIFLYMLFGSIFYGIVEGWSFIDAFYFSGMTVTTVGYGDLTPTYAISKIFTILYAFFGIGIVFYSLGVMGKQYVEQEEKRIARAFERAIGMDKELEKKFEAELESTRKFKKK